MLILFSTLFKENWQKTEEDMFFYGFKINLEKGLCKRALEEHKEEKINETFGGTNRKSLR